MKAAICACAIAVALVATGSVVFAVKVGEPAPAFTGTDNNGKTVKLDDFKGKFVVLEWTSKDCPYIVKHYKSGNMQKLQKEWTAKGVAWVSIISSGEGKPGYVTPEQSRAYVQEQQAAPTSVILDPKGDIGHLYAAKTTPHMFIIDPKGIVIYDGALDDKSTTNIEDVATANNYVSAALTEAMAGKPVTTPTSRPYG